MTKKRLNSRSRAKTRIRKKIEGTSDRPRLTVYRSLNHMYVQLIDDAEGKTLAAASSKSEEIADEMKNAKNKTEKSKLVGKLLAQKALEKKIESVVFDRNGYKFHGRIQAIADGAREGGLKF